MTRQQQQVNSFCCVITLPPRTLLWWAAVSITRGPVTWYPTAASDMIWKSILGDRPSLIMFRLINNLLMTRCKCFFDWQRAWGLIAALKSRYEITVGHLSSSVIMIDTERHESRQGRASDLSFQDDHGNEWNSFVQCHQLFTWHMMNDAPLAAPVTQHW